MRGQKTRIRCGRDSGLAENFDFRQLLQHSCYLRNKIFSIRKLNRRQAISGGFDIRRQGRRQMKQNVLHDFFLRSGARFNNQLKRSRQTLTGSHPASDSIFFRNGIELNDDRLFFLIIN